MKRLAIAADGYVHGIPDKVCRLLVKFNNETDMKKGNVRTLEQFKDKYYGKPGAARRKHLDTGYKIFKAEVSSLVERKTR